MVAETCKIMLLYACGHDLSFFRIFEKSKNQCQKRPFKIDHRAPQGRLILPFWQVSGDARESLFFDDYSRAPKNHKKSFLGTPRCRSSAAAGASVGGPGGVGIICIPFFHLCIHFNALAGLITEARHDSLRYRATNRGGKKLRHSVKANVGE